MRAPRGQRPPCPLSPAQRRHARFVLVGKERNDGIVCQRGLRRGLALLPHPRRCADHAETAHRLSPCDIVGRRSNPIPPYTGHRSAVRGDTRPAIFVRVKPVPHDPRITDGLRRIGCVDVGNLRGHWIRPPEQRQARLELSELLHHFTAREQVAGHLLDQHSRCVDVLLDQRVLIVVADSEAAVLPG
jgi:hypothetical protein